jgi:hypothetical protein
MKKALPSEKLKPFMIYIDDGRLTAVKKLAKKSKTTITQTIREGIDLRLTPGSHVAGFNQGIRKAMDVINQNKAAQMRFPSGKSFAELLNEEMETFLLEENHEN